MRRPGVTHGEGTPPNFTAMVLFALAHVGETRILPVHGTDCLVADHALLRPRPPSAAVACPDLGEEGRAAAH